MASLVLKNGLVAGWGNIVVPIGGVIITGINDISLGYNQDKKNIMGNGFQPVGRGRGNFTYDPGKMTILWEEWKAICAASPDSDPVNLNPFTIPISYVDRNGAPIGKTEFVSNVEFTGVSRDYKQGDSALWLPVSFIYAGISQ